MRPERYDEWVCAGERELHTLNVDKTVDSFRQARLFISSTKSLPLCSFHGLAGEKKEEKKKKKRQRGKV